MGGLFMKEIEKTIYDLCLPICHQNNLTLLSVEDCFEHGNRVIKIIIDSALGISIDDVTLVNELLSNELDRVDPIPDEYFLEVSSPGAERELKSAEEISQAIGKYLSIKLKEKITIGTKCYLEIEGTLTLFDGESLTLLTKIKQFNKEVTIPYQKVAKVRLAIKF